MVYKVQSLWCLVLYCSCLFSYTLSILTLFVNCVYHLIEKKIKPVCQRHYFRGDKRTVYKISGPNRKKVIVAVNCRAGYKFEYYQKKHKILTSKLKFL